MKPFLNSSALNQLIFTLFTLFAFLWPGVTFTGYDSSLVIWNIIFTRIVHYKLGSSTLTKFYCQLCVNLQKQNIALPSTIDYVLFVLLVVAQDAQNSCQQFHSIASDAYTFQKESDELENTDGKRGKKRKLRQLHVFAETTMTWIRHWGYEIVLHN